MFHVKLFGPIDALCKSTLKRRWEVQRGDLGLARSCDKFKFWFCDFLEISFLLLPSIVLMEQGRGTSERQSRKDIAQRAPESFPSFRPRPGSIPVRFSAKIDDPRASGLDRHGLLGSSHEPRPRDHRSDQFDL